MYILYTYDVLIVFLRFDSTIFYTNILIYGLCKCNCIDFAATCGACYLSWLRYLKVQGNILGQYIMCSLRMPYTILLSPIYMGMSELN